MKQSLTLLTIAALLAACSNPRPSLRPHGRWSDGVDVFFTDSVAADYVSFYGSNKGGINFEWKASIKSNGEMVMLPDKDKPEDTESAIDKAGNRLSVRIFGPDTVLVVSKPNGTAVDVFEGMPGDPELSNIETTLKTRYALGGDYVDEATGKSISFAVDEPKVTGFSAGDKYSFGTPWDQPEDIQDILTFPGDSAYAFTVTDTGLDFFRAFKVAEDGDWSIGEKAYSLRRTRWPDLSGDSKLQGHYTFASGEVMTRGILSNFTARQRRIMRNEIFARYGYRFKNPELRTYFLAQPWYIPSADDVTARLTPLEKLNVEMLEAYDKR